MFNATINATISAVENNVAGIGEAQADVARASTQSGDDQQVGCTEPFLRQAWLPRERMAE
jgi:hypothetical protein